MGSLNVAEWTPDQVAEWMKGLGVCVAGYAERLRARGVGGARLLALRCDELEALGVRAIGHQELVLEGVEQLRNFQYELSRECVQQLALRVSVCAGGAARALRAQAHGDQRLETQALMDVARAVAAVKTLVCWLERMVGAAGLRGRAGALLALCLEACTSAQRDRFAEQPARAVAAAARAAAALADHIVQDVSDPVILQPASLEQVTLAQGARPLGFAVLPSCGGYQQLGAIRFGSPAHASGAVRPGDEIVQVGSVCVIGWSGPAVEQACSQRGAAGELTLRLRRRTQTPALPAHQQLRNRSRLEALEASRALLEAPAPREDASSSDSEPLSPPASPTAPPDHTRMYPPKPRALARRRHSVSCASPTAKRPPPGIEQFWQELAQQRWRSGGSAGGSPEPLEALYRRDKAVSCSTGLELSPRPRTCLGVALNHPLVQKLNAARLAAEDEEARDARARGKLDKSHSTPAYDFDGGAGDEPGSLATQTIPESPTTPTDSPTILVHSAEKADQILDFKKSSSQIEEAILQQKNRRLTDERNEFSFTDEKDDSCEFVETINTAVTESHVIRRASLKSPSEGRKMPTGGVIREEPAMRQPRPAPPARSDVPPEPPPRPLATQRSILREPPMPPAETIREYPALRPVRQPEEPSSPLKPVRLGEPVLRHISKHDIRVVGGERRELPPLNAEEQSGGGGLSLGAGFPGPPAAPHTPCGGVRAMFPTYKSKSLKKKNSLLAKRRCVAARALAGRGAGGAVWQRVRARHAQQPRWARRYLLLCDGTLYAYRSAECSRADCMIQLAGFTAAAAGEVKSRPHAFKVYHTGTAFYFACESADTARAWLALIQRATHEHAAPQTSGEMPKQYSETDYSTDSDAESERTRDRERDRDKEKEKEKDKSKFGSLKKLTHRMQRSESSEAVGGAAASLDRKYLRFFSRARHKDDKPAKSKQSNVPVPTEHYRSYRRVSQHDTPPSPSPPRLAPPAPAPRLPKPINYIHASNPNLLDFEKSEFVTRPSPRPFPLARPKVHKPDNFVGFVTLEEFMLKKQEEERRQVYTNRVLLGVERGERDASLQRRLREVVPDVLYGALPPSSLPAPLAELQARSLPRAPPPPRRDAPGKPVSVKGKDGYEKIVYTEEKPVRVERMRRASPPAAAEHPQQPPEPPRWRDSLRRNDKVHSGAGAGASAGAAAGAGAGAGSARRVAPLAPLAAAAAVESVAASGGAGAGVSRLRLMFSGRSVSRETHRQESVPAARAATPPRGAPAPGSPGVAPGAAPGVAPGAAPGAAATAPGSEWAWRTAQYPHLQCPPTFQPESYSLASRLARPPPD